MAKFVSECTNLVLCMKPARTTIQDGFVVPQPGEHIRFYNGEYETADKNEMDFIKRHRLFGSKIIEVVVEKKTAAAE